MKKIFILLFVASLLNACNNGDVNDRLGSNEYMMKQGLDKSFSLDSITTQETNYIQMIDDDRIALYNPPGNTICIFNHYTGSELEKIQLYKEGPQAVRGIQGFYYHNSDSVWLYQSWENMLVLVNNKGEIINRNVLREKYNHVSQLQKCTVSPFPFSDMPIKKWGDWFILQGMNGPEVKNGFSSACTILYNLRTDSIRLVNEYPSLYGENQDMNENWGTFSYRTVPYALNMRNEMVLSFPADDSIRVNNLIDGTMTSHFAGYSKKHSVRPISGNQKSDLQRHYLEQIQYAGIFYDKYRNLYYRLALLPTSDYDINDETTHEKPLSVIILDSSFSKVGEFDLGKGRYYYRHSFVAEEGLCINIYSEDDDYLKFRTLIPQRNEK
jgi:hypothetical protein